MPESEDTQPEVYTVTVGGRAIVLPAPDNGCKRTDQLGMRLPVPIPFGKRLVASFIAGDATPTQPHFSYVLCARFFAGRNETRSTFLRLQGTFMDRDQSEASIFDTTDDSMCWWKEFESQNLIATSCMMLVSQRVLYLYSVCHQDLSNILAERMAMMSWRDRILKANPM
jgi:hypothetical protein